MGNRIKNKQVFRIRVLLFSVFVCAWMLSASIGMALSASDHVRVSVSVMDAVGVHIGTSALVTHTEDGFSRVITGPGTDSDILITVTDL